jgi:hypothetical protein
MNIEKTVQSTLDEVTEVLDLISHPEKIGFVRTDTTTLADIMDFLKEKGYIEKCNSSVEQLKEIINSKSDI